MNIKKLAEKLKPWMQVDTWHTTHPLDCKRFHKALNTVFNEFGTSISYDDFKDAMSYLSETMFPGKFGDEYLESTIERYASNAETIASYLSDTKI